MGRGRQNKEEVISDAGGELQVLNDSRNRELVSSFLFKIYIFF